MATKVNADNLQKLSTTHKNVSASVKAKTSKAQATTTKLKLDTSRNPAVKAVPARAQAVAQRVTTKSTTISNRSTELAKRADYVREQAAKASTVKAPVKRVAMPATTTSANKAKASAVKLGVAAKTRPKAPIVKPQPRRETFLRPLPMPKKNEEPIIKEQFKRNDIVEKIRRVEVMKGAGGKVRTYFSRAANEKVGGKILPTSVATTTLKTNKTGPHDNPSKPVATRTGSVVFSSGHDFVGKSETINVAGVVQLTGTRGAYMSHQVGIRREGGKTELYAKGNLGATVRGTATTGFELGRGTLTTKVAAKGSVMGGADLGGEASATYSSRQASIKAKAAVFAGIGADVDTSIEFLGTKLFAEGGVSAGIGAMAQGELSASPTRLKGSVGAGLTFGPGGKVKLGIEVDVAKATAAANNLSRAVTGQDVATNVRKSQKNVVWAAQNPGQAAIAIGRNTVAGAQKLGTAIVTSKPVKKLVAVTRTVGTGIANGARAVAKPVAKALVHGVIAFRKTSTAVVDGVAQAGKATGKMVNNGVKAVTGFLKGWGL
jgi:hypothetical protein